MEKCIPPKKLIKPLYIENQNENDFEYSGEKLLVPLKNNISWDYDSNSGDGWITGIARICVTFSCYNKCISVATDFEASVIKHNYDTKLNARNTDLVFSIVQKDIRDTGNLILQGRELCVG